MTVKVVTTHPAFLAALLAWAESVKEKILAVAEAFAPQAENDLEIGVEDLASIAGTAVLAQAGAVLSGTEKSSAAVQQVISTVEASGKTIALADAQAAVEQAYQTVKTVANAAPAATAQADTAVGKDASTGTG